MTDFEAYNSYPEDSIWYNKLFVAGILNYNSGCSCIPASGKYIIKPIVNLQGCGIGAQIREFKKGDSLPKDFFWSEVYTGRHITIDYERVNGAWQQGHTFEGFKDDPNDLLRFSLWRRVEYPYQLPTAFDNIKTKKINIEVIDDRIIEVHLRHNTDPVQYDFFIPIWDEQQQCPEGCVRIEDKEDHPGRLGFFVSQKT